MVRSCHRCHAELPAGSSGERSFGASLREDEQALFCPRCGAPQIYLPEYMRSELPAANPSATTGALPPPRLQMIEWAVVFSCIAPVALASGTFAVAGLFAPAASLLNTLCILAGSGIVLGLYRSRRPLARVNGRIGLHIGLVTGLAMLGAIGLGLAGTGLIERFGTHGMSGFDRGVRQFGVLFQQRMQAQGNSPEMQQQFLTFMSSPEIRAGVMLAYLAFLSGFVLLLTSAGGGLAGVLQARRRGLIQRL